MRQTTPRTHIGRPAALLGVATLVASLLGCGGASDPPESQPAPDVSTFETGRFDDLPLHPAPPPLRTETDASGPDDGGESSTEVVTRYSLVLTPP